jgi:hypothetical protein
LISALVESFQQLRDEGKLNITAQKLTTVVNAIASIPTVLYKSYDPRSLFEAFYIHGFIGESRQGPDVNRSIGTYKKTFTIDGK